MYFVIGVKSFGGFSKFGRKCSERTTFILSSVSSKVAQHKLYLKSKTYFNDLQFRRDGKFDSHSSPMPIKFPRTRQK